MDISTEVFAWGSNQYGQQGLGDSQDESANSFPLFLSHNIQIRALSCGDLHSAFISFSGHLYTMGSNENGRLGIGNRQILKSPSPCLIESLNRHKLTQVSCGGGHSIVLTKTGKAFSWGEGEFGALGTGSIASAWQPRPVQISHQVHTMSVGTRHSVFLSKNKVFVCGAGESGQLGTGIKEREIIPVRINLKNIAKVAAGAFHTLFADVAGILYATGGNANGQLGISHQKNSLTPIKVEFLEGLFVKKIAAGSHSSCITEDGTLYIWGSETVPSAKLVGFRKVSVGGSVGLGIDLKGNVHAWGSNNYGELGQGHSCKQTGPVKVSALKDKFVGEVDCGSNFCVALGGDIYWSPNSSKKRCTLRNGLKNSRKIKKKKKTNKHSLQLSAEMKLNHSKCQSDTFDPEIDYLKRQIAAIQQEIITKENIICEKEFGNTGPNSLVKTIHTLNEERNEWEEKYNNLLKENAVLLNKFEELEEDNKENFKALGKKLSEKAKEYREKTVQLLNGQNAPKRVEEYQSTMFSTQDFGESQDAHKSKIQRLMQKHRQREENIN